MIAQTFSIAGNTQQDVDINLLVSTACTTTPSVCREFTDIDNNGTIDSYGVVKIEFDNTIPNSFLLGRVATYRPIGNFGTSFSTAFARELRSPSKGTTFSQSNTHDALGRSTTAVANWAEIIYIGDGNGASNDVMGFTIKFYNQAGNLISQTRLTLSSLQEQDVAAGHHLLDANGQIIQEVYQVEVIPDLESKDYFAWITRYAATDNTFTDFEDLLLLALSTKVNPKW